MSRSAKRVALLAALLLATIVSLLATLRAPATQPGPSADVRSSQSPRPPFVMFRTLAPPEGHGRVATLSLATRDATRQVGGLSCLRLHYAGGRGLCLVQETAENPPTYAAFVFDESLTRGVRFALSGVPTRVRVAPNGRRAAITTYEEEERPEGERLATHSIIVDLQSGQVLADLREFRLELGAFAAVPGLSPVSSAVAGRADVEAPIGAKAEPLDFSSVAFEPDSDRFFATLTTSSERFLVAGSVDQRALRIIRPGIASEGLSPDGRHLAIKRLIDERGAWQLGVIDVQSWNERDLRQGSSSVDDQVEWWDDRHVLYHDMDGDTTSVWILPVDGVNGPRVAIKDAYSAAVQR